MLCVHFKVKKFLLKNIGDRIILLILKINIFNKSITQGNEQSNKYMTHI